MFGTIGLPELLLIFLIVLVIFGAGKLPQLGKGIGEGIRNFRSSLKGEDAPKQDAPKNDDSKSR
ncbi:MAG TPA: twin-arginine translocase TatA/TatE family subunit [Thermoanaerobaculaceae bacterium]|nr:twin-arginine translocase TatA/TatE family subunit [Thermoanaerobaculaceae bacterium]